MHSQFEPQPEAAAHVGEETGLTLSPVPSAFEATQDAATKQMPAPADVLLEQFLERLVGQMREDVTEEAREEMRREVSGHLLVSAAAHEELGMSPEEAMRAAIARFGSPERIGSDLRREQTSCRIAWRDRLLCGLIGMGVGSMTAAPLFARADCELLRIGLVAHQGGAAMYWFGGILGAVIGTVAAKRRLSLWSATVWGVKCNVAFVLTIQLLNSLPNRLPIRNLYDFVFLSVMLLLFGTLGAITGAATGAANLLLRRVFGETPKHEVSAS